MTFDLLLLLGFTLMSEINPNLDRKTALGTQGGGRQLAALSSGSLRV